MKAIYGRLTVLERRPGDKNHHPTVLCLCDCGSLRVARWSKVKSGDVVECATCARQTAGRKGGATRSLSLIDRHLRVGFGEYRSNARCKGLLFDLDLAAFTELALRPCHYCGAAPSPVNGIDRVDSSVGYITSNVVTACSPCNYAKRDMSVADFLALVERIHAYQSLLQRDRPVRMRVAQQPDGRGPHHPGGDLRQVNRRSDARRGSRL